MSCVVVVDDDATIRLLLTHAFDRLGIAVRSFQDGRTALADLETTSCELMLVDYQLPDMTGLELTKAVRGHYPFLTVALITGSAHLVTPDAISTVDITQVFQKPFDLEELTEWVRAQLGGP